MDSAHRPTRSQGAPWSVIHTPYWVFNSLPVPVVSSAELPSSTAQDLMYQQRASWKHSGELSFGT